MNWRQYFWKNRYTQIIVGSSVVLVANRLTDWFELIGTPELFVVEALFITIIIVTLINGTAAYNTYLTTISPRTNPDGEVQAEKPEGEETH